MSTCVGEALFSLSDATLANETAALRSFTLLTGTTKPVSGHNIISFLDGVGGQASLVHIKRGELNGSQ